MAAMEIKPTDSVNVFKLKYDEIKEIFNKLYLDDLRNICRENKISGFITAKADVLSLIFKHYDKWYSLLSKLKFRELLDICIKNKLIVEDCKGLSKDMFVHILISSIYIKNKIIKHSVVLDQDLSEDNIKSILNHIEEYSKKTQTPKENVSIPEEEVNVIDKKTIILSEIDQAKQKLDELIAEKTRQDELIKKQEKILEKKKKKEDEENKRLD